MREYILPFVMSDFLVENGEGVEFRASFNKIWRTKLVRCSNYPAKKAYCMQIPIDMYPFILSVAT